MICKNSCKKLKYLKVAKENMVGNLFVWNSLFTLNFTRLDGCKGSSKGTVVVHERKSKKSY